MFEILLSDVPEGSILNPTFFSMLLNDLLIRLTKSDIHNFANDNAISVTSRESEKLVK